MYSKIIVMGIIMNSKKERLYREKAEALGKTAGDKEVMEVEEKLPAMNRGPVKKIWDKVVFLWDAYRKAEIPVRLKITIIGALLYLILPADIVPDVIPGIGLVDDCAVILIVFNEVSKFLVPKVVKKLKTTIQESYYSKIDFKLKEVFYTMLVNSAVTFCINMAGIAILLVNPVGEYSRYVAFGIFGIVFIYTMIRIILYFKHYGNITLEIMKHVFKEKSLSRGVGLFVTEKYPVITKIYAGINIAQNFIPGLDSVPDFDLIVKDFITHYRKKIILVAALFILYTAVIFMVKVLLAR